MGLFFCVFCMFCVFCVQVGFVIQFMVLSLMVLLIFWYDSIGRLLNIGCSIVLMQCWQLSDIIIVSGWLWWFFFSGWVLLRIFIIWLVIVCLVLCVRFSILFCLVCMMVCLMCFCKDCLNSIILSMWLVLQNCLVICWCKFMCISFMRLIMFLGFLGDYVIRFLKMVCRLWIDMFFCISWCSILVMCCGGIRCVSLVISLLCL